MGNTMVSALPTPSTDDDDKIHDETLNELFPESENDEDMVRPRDATPDYFGAEIEDNAEIST